MHRPGSKADKRERRRQRARSLAFDMIEKSPRGGVPMEIFAPWVREEIRKASDGKNPRFSVTEDMELHKETIWPRIQMS